MQRKDMMVIDGYEFKDEFGLFDGHYLESDWPIAIPKGGQIFYGYAYRSTYKDEEITIFVSMTYGGVFPMEIGKTYFKHLSNQGEKTKESEIKGLQERIKTFEAEIKRLEEGDK